MIGKQGCGLMGVFFSDEIRKGIECLLFVACEPLSLKKLAELTGNDENTVYFLLLELQQFYQGHGFELVETAGGWQFYTRPELAGYVEKLYRPKMNLFSKAALETLAIIAYKQPITRAEVEEIRGVKTEGVLNTLLEKKLVRDIGKKNSPGKPILYGTTTDFLHAFGIKSLEELPNME
jgi:segregation and condensation protein B